MENISESRKYSAWWCSCPVPDQPHRDEALGGTHNTATVHGKDKSWRVQNIKLYGNVTALNYIDIQIGQRRDLQDSFKRLPLQIVFLNIPEEKLFKRRNHARFYYVLCPWCKEPAGNALERRDAECWLAEPTNRKFFFILVSPARLPLLHVKSWWADDVVTLANSGQE